jgi:hypothetical protein
MVSIGVFFLVYRYFIFFYKCIQSDIIEYVHLLSDLICKMVDGHYVVSLLGFANVIELVGYFVNRQMNEFYSK